ncbi:MAG: hypothetical protein ACRCUF_14285, partial [Aeromonas sobria]
MATGLLISKDPVAPNPFGLESLHLDIKGLLTGRNPRKYLARRPIRRTNSLLRQFVISLSSLAILTPLNYPISYVNELT